MFIIIMYSAAVSMWCDVQCVRSSVRGQQRCARNDDDRFSKQLNILINYYYKYFSLSLNAF